MGPVKIALSDTILVDIPFMRVFNHSYPLALLGADVLKPRAPAGGYMYSGMVNEIEGNQIKSYITFRDG